MQIGQYKISLFSATSFFYCVVGFFFKELKKEATALHIRYIWYTTPRKVQRE